MNEASTWRLELARDHIAPAYASDERVLAIALVGGAARGLADAWSDLDLIAYWHQTPAAEARRAVVATLGGQDLAMDDSEIRRPDLALQSRADSWYLGGGSREGLKVDVTHKLVVSMDKLVADVTQRQDADRRKLNVLHSIQRAWPILGAERIQAWAEGAGRLPDAVAEDLARRQLPRFAPWTYRMLGQRDDALLYQLNLAGDIERLIMLLHAAGRAYPPRTLKHLDRCCQELPLAPADLAGRIRRCLTARPAVAARLMGPLIEETLELVQPRLPGLAGALDDLHARMRHVRASHTSRPSTNED